MVMAVIVPLFRMSLELQLKLWMLMRHNAWRHSYRLLRSGFRSVIKPCLSWRATIQTLDG